MDNYAPTMLSPRLDAVCARPQPRLRPPRLLFVSLLAQSGILLPPLVAVLLEVAAYACSSTGSSIPSSVSRKCWVAIARVWLEWLGVWLGVWWLGGRGRGQRVRARCVCREGLVNTCLRLLLYVDLADLVFRYD